MKKQFYSNKEKKVNHVKLNPNDKGVYTIDNCKDGETYSISIKEDEAKETPLKHPKT